MGNMGAGVEGWGLMCPSFSEQEKYGPLAKRLYLRYLLAHTQKRMGFYLHTIAMHGGAYMDEFGSLGKYR